MKRFPVLAACALLVSAAAVPAVAQESSTEMRVEAEGSALSIPLGRTVGTVCDPAHWAQPGARTCDILILGTFRGTLTRAATGRVEPVWGHYRARVTITTAAHAPGCLETAGGPISFSVFGKGGSRGTVVSDMDESDSQVCQQQPGSTDRSYFIRSDPTRGSGVFRGVQGGTTNLEGSGSQLGRSSIYRNDLNLFASVQVPAA